MKATKNEKQNFVQKRLQLTVSPEYYKFEFSFS